MCGIFALLNNTNYCHVSTDLVEESFKKGSSRGPEYSTLKTVMIKTLFGFHRLAINGLDKESHQPIVHNNVALICNGEIYNYKILYDLCNEDNDSLPTTNSDCEIIIHLYLKYGIEQTLQMLDGVFSFVLIDYRMRNDNTKLYVARDPYGVRPLYFIKPESKQVGEDQIYAFASELKSLYGIWSKLDKDYKTMRSMKKLHFKQVNNNHSKYKIHQFRPGTLMTLELPFNAITHWNHKSTTTYHNFSFSQEIFKPLKSFNKDYYYNKINETFKTAVYKRCSTTDRPIACLLSGGLDSSLVTALVNEYHKEHNLGKLETYSIGLKDSEDLKYSQIVADYLGTKHTQIIVSEEEFVESIESVIRDIESYDTTTVRASIGNWLVSKHISENSNAKVIFNGDGADELMGGYLYMKYANDAIEFDSECRRLLKNIYMFDVLRSDKSISSHGLEPRTPFLDRSWVNFYLSMPLVMRYNPFKIEKFNIRKAFSINYFKNKEGKQLLPDETLWRRKEAFSDGVSNKQKDTKDVIYDKIKSLFKNENEMLRFIQRENVSDNDFVKDFIRLDGTMNEVDNYLLPTTIEQCYYRKIFETYYGGCGKILPYFWMPRYVSATDSSARTLEIYSEIITTNE